MSESAILQATSYSYEEIFLGIVSALSLVACFVTIIVYLMIDNINSTYKRFVIALTFSDLIYSFCNHYTAFIIIFYHIPTEGETYCTILGVLRQYSFNASTNVVFFISLFIYFVAIDKSEHIQNNSYKYLALGMLTPALVSAWFVYSNGIGVEGKWCFPKDNWQAAILVHGFYAVPMIATFILVLMSAQIIRARGKTIRVWPPLLQLCFLPISLLSKFDYKENDIYQSFMIFFGAIACLNGFFNGCVYGWNKETREEFFKKIGCSQNSELKQRLAS